VARLLVWGLLILALVAAGAAAVVQWLGRPEPPPVLGTLPDFALVNRDGRTITRADLAGAPWVADFIFTRCPSSCPLMTARMARFARDVSRGPQGLRFHLVSISVEPDHDTPAVLARYAAGFEAPPHWLFLTGSRDAVLTLSRDGFKLGLEMTPPPPPAGVELPEPILHSTRFVLVDGDGRIRGYYEAFDEESMARLRKDLWAIARG
jgi:protein SCO1/2